ncbi:MAG: AAA family ATPase [Hormoscilla sp.]
MRIQQISVSGLFGIFDHVIPLNMDDRITIIHGPNGFGKTIILRMINGFFNYRYSVFRKIPFSKFQFKFDNGSSVKIVNSYNKREKTAHQQNLEFIFEKLDSEAVPFIPKSKMRASDVEILDHIIPMLFRVGPREWRDSTTGEILSLADVLDRFEDLLPPEMTMLEEDPEWLKNLKSEIDVRLIESQRLVNFVPIRFIESQQPMVNFVNIRSSISYNTTGSSLPTVSAYSQEIAKLMQDKFTEYGTISQSLDRTFPVRVVKQQSSTNWTDEQLRHQLDELDKKRDRLIEVGLLNQDENPDIEFPRETRDESTRNLLSVYVEDVEKKLNVFSDIASKIELLKRIINKKIAYSYKEMNVSKKKGFVFTTRYHPDSPSGPKELSPTDLSSGEQHELVLLYELLFKVKPNSLVLIDEPELSLHVGWQVEFLRDMQEITKLADVDILMATHSPDIIQDRWDLTVELKGPEK